jgi:hypothetical protein
MNIIQVIAFLGFLPLVLAQSTSTSVNFHPRSSNRLLHKVHSPEWAAAYKKVCQIIVPFFLRRFIVPTVG